MREVRTCDFCGDEAAGAFEVIPPERDPTGEGRRMLLCPGCRDTLASVIEPLLDGETADHDRTGREPTSKTATVVAEPDRETRDPDRETGIDTGTDTDIATALDRATAAGEEPDRETGSNPDQSTDSVSSTSEDGAGGDVEEAGGRPRRARRGTPRGYRKVMRFLENREFPMERERAETLVSEAYGMNPESVSAVIDHAVKHNRMREASGKLFQ